MKSTLTHLYRQAIHLYPLEFKKEFGQEMNITFSSMLDEAHTNRELLQICISSLKDLLISILLQYFHYFFNTPMKKTIAIISAIIMLPAFLLFFGGIIMQGLGQTHLMQPLLTSHVYGTYFIRIIFVALPLVTILLNIIAISIPIVKVYGFSGKLTFGVVQENILGISFICFALGIVTFLYFHDTVGCMAQILQGIQHVQICIATH